MLTILSQLIQSDLDGTAGQYKTENIARQRRTDIICIELIHPNENANCSSAESPSHHRADNGKLAFM